MEWLTGMIGAAAAAGAGGWWWLKHHGIDPRLLWPLLRTGLRKATVPIGDFHVFLCIADHFEPKFGRPSMRQARGRVQRWLHEYPRRFDEFQDSDGRSPRHTFFYPLEDYEAEFLDGLGELCRQGFGEVEVHLHHEGETAEQLRDILTDYKHLVAQQHGLLASHRDTGNISYGFIHGNWALCNSRPDGRWCGINHELDVLRETGCYADFTMPSAPHVTQTRTINSIYYATNRPGYPKSHDRGIELGKGPQPPASLMLIQGPLVPYWRSSRFRILPRLENGCLQASQPPALPRLEDWLRARVQVPTRPDWFFVKLHCHGAPENAHETLLGKPMVDFHRSLAKYAEQFPHFKYHYVSAREMYNLARAAEAGYQGSVVGALDYELVWNGDTESFLLDPRRGANALARQAIDPISRPGNVFEQSQRNEDEA